MKSGDLVKSLDHNALAVVLCAGNSPIFDGNTSVVKILVQGECRPRYTLETDLVVL